MSIISLLTSVASGVEMSLAFAMSTKVVDTLVSLLKPSTMEWRSASGFVFGGGGSGTDSMPSILSSGIVLVLSTGLLLLSAISLLARAIPSSRGKSRMRAAFRDLASITKHVVILSTTRIILALLVISDASQEQDAMVSMSLTTPFEDENARATGRSSAASWATPAIFNSARSILQIMFAAVFLSCTGAIFVARQESPTVRKSNRGSNAGSVRNGEEDDDMAMSSFVAIVGNVQRTFAQHVSLLVPESGARRTLVLFGLCIFPKVTGILLKGMQPMAASSAAAAATVQPSSANMNMMPGSGLISGLIGTSFANSHADGAVGAEATRERESTVSPNANLASRRSQAFSAFLLQVWLIAACTTWLNLSIELILTGIDTTSSSSGTEMASMGTKALWSVGLCILSKSLHGILPGMQLFQGFVEWNVAIIMTAGIQGIASADLPSQQQQHFITMSACSVLFLSLDSLVRDISRLQASQRRPSSASRRVADATLVMTKNACTVVYSISTIMLTNSFVAWCMDVVSASSYSDSIDTPNSTGIGTALCTIVVGILVSQIMLHIVTLSQSRMGSVTKGC
jgi:hypothetical protein